MQYCIYLRKSRADLEAENNGEADVFKRHEHALLTLAKAQNLNVTQIYHEVVSGDTIANRPVMQKLLSEVEQGVWAGVIVMDIDRLARGNTIDQGIVFQTFKYAETLVVTPTYDPNDEYDEEYFEFGLFMARREYKVISRRMHRGLIASVKEGNFVAGQVPYGYEKVYIKKGNITLKIIPDEAKVVRLIFDLYINGEYSNGQKVFIGPAKIATRLNAAGIPTKRHTKWRKDTIRGILTNPTYIGKIRYRWRINQKKMVNGALVVTRPNADESLRILVDGRHDPIIDVDTFNTAQQIFESRFTVPLIDKSVLKNPLAGIVICAKCGRSMCRQTEPNGHPILICRSCDNAGSYLHVVEEKILIALHDWLDKYALELNKKQSSSNQFTEILNKINNDLGTLNQQQNNLYNLLERGIYSNDIFLERNKTLAEQRESLLNEKKKIEESLKDYISFENAKHNITPKIQNLLKIYNDLETPLQKNSVLKEVLDHVEYFKAKKDRKNLQITIYPRLPSKLHKA